MSEHINAGATDLEGARIPTKKELIRRMKQDPASVLFDPTGMFGSQDPIPGNDIPKHVTLMVCGPDPRINRKWYANVKLSPKGVLLVT